MRARVVLIAAVLITTMIAACAGPVMQRPSATRPSPASSEPPGATPSSEAARSLIPDASIQQSEVPAGVPFAGHLLIADRGNGRIVEIGPDGNESWSFPRTGQVLPPHIGPWDDAFYTPDGRTVVANAEDAHVVIAIDVASARVLWQAGAPGTPGAGSEHFNTPDDAVPAADGTIHVADIRNCRIVHLSASGGFTSYIGDGRCVHDPPRAFGSPNGAFPTPDGGLIVTEIRGNWVTWLDRSDRVIAAVQAPTAYPSDALPDGDGTVLLTDYTRPGQVIRLSREGKVLWRYAPSGTAALDHPSIAMPLARNRVAICDDEGDRVLIVDPRTNEIVKEYRSIGGIRLDLPDGLAYRPD